MVRFSVAPGTTQALAAVGVRDSSMLTATLYPQMPVVSSGWVATSAFFKSEGGVINVGLGSGTALDIFNGAITSFRAIS
jgi:hypothetical protein